VAKIRGTAFVVRTSVRFYGDESAYADHGQMNPPSTVFGQTLHLSVAKICRHVFIVRTLVRFYGDESPPPNPLSTIFSQALFSSMLRQFFLTIPLELSDAARIDGAGEIQILTRVILPLARPALAMVALFQLSVAKIRGTAFIVRTSVRFYGDESAYADHGRMNPPSTVFGQAPFNLWARGGITWDR
jgi:hypothetical protein